MKKFLVKSINIRKRSFAKCIKLFNNSVKNEDDITLLKNELYLEKTKRIELQKQIDLNNKNSKDNEDSVWFTLKFFGIGLTLYFLLILVGSLYF